MFTKDRRLTALQYRTLIKKGVPFIEREHSVRGLESLIEHDLDTENSHHHHHRNNSNRHSNKETACHEDLVKQHAKVILDEQIRQRVAGCYPNLFTFRSCSERSSRAARHRAAVLGEADALAGYVSSSRALQRRSMGMVHSISRKIQG